VPSFSKQNDMSKASDIPGPKTPRPDSGGEKASTSPSPSPLDGEGDRGGEVRQPRRLPVSPDLQHQMLACARAFRRHPTPSEAILWQALRARQRGVKFRRQQPIGPFVVDFFCAERRLIVEVDGPVHALQVEYDRERQWLLEQCGYQVLRVAADAVEGDLRTVLRAIDRALTPAPSPSPGEGNADVSTSPAPSPLDGEGDRGGEARQAAPTIALSHLRFHLVPEQDLHLPAHNKGNSLRGGFGSAFRKLVCVDLRWECAQCTLRYSCPYTKVFNPFIPPAATQFTGNQNIPRPFVVKPPLTPQTRYAAGEPLVFDLAVVGSAIDYLPYFIVAFRELGATGFGLNRARVQLARVDAIAVGGSATTVYEASTNLVRPAAPIELSVAETLTPTLSRQERECIDCVTLQFFTPTTLKTGSTDTQPGVVVRRPAFVVSMEELRTFVIYDIDERIRTKIADTCFDFGLVRVQYSAFAGALNRNKREELFLRLRDRLGAECGKILVQPVCEKDVASMLLHDNDRPPEEDL